MSVSGNLIYWLYVVGLPAGPIWALQAFFTLSDFLMFGYYVHFELRNGGLAPQRRRPPLLARSQRGKKA